MIDVNELIKRGDDYMDGFQKGREFAIEKYNKMFVELWDKLNEMEKTINKNFVLLFDALKIIERHNRKER